MGNNIKVSIIIRAFNEEKHIGNLLQEIFKQETNFDFDVIIVDSGSTDKTLKIANEYPLKVIKINPDDFTFGYSLNKGIEAASGDYCVIVSAHCYPQSKNWLSELIEPFKNKKISLVYGRQIGNGRTRFSEQQIFKSWFPDNSVNKQKHPFCNNANSAIRRSLWKKIKYDEALTGLEDIDWAKKTMREGFNVYYNPDAVVFHLHEETYKQIYYRYKREAIAMHEVYPEENFSFFDFLRLLFINIFADYYTSIKEHQFIKNFSEIPMFRLYQFYGTYKGFKYKKKLTKELKKKFYYPI